tara:strand:+ start:490 stop:1227 length:738 start_codon:yes stop_codon:yes gene_type:complete
MPEYAKTIISALSSTNSDYSDPRVIVRDLTQADTNEFSMVRHVKLETSNANTGLNQGFQIFSEFDGWSNCTSMIVHNTGTSELSILLYVVLADLTSSTLTNVTVSASGKSFTAATSAATAPFLRGNLGPDATHANVYAGAVSGNLGLYEINTMADTFFTVKTTPGGGDQSNDSTMRIQLVQRQIHYVPAGGLFVHPGLRRLINVSAAGTAEASFQYHGFTSYDSSVDVSTGVEGSFTLYMTGTNG